MLRYIGYAPVHEMLVVLLALTPIARNTQLYNSCARVRWQFLEQLSEWVIMLRITEIIVKSHELCYINSYVTPELHSTAGSQLLLDLIEKLSLEDTGELLLQPLGYDITILDSFINTSINPNCDDNIRRSTCRLICFLLRRAAEPEIICIVNTAPGTPPHHTCIPNRLYPLRERIVLHIETRLIEIFHSILNFQFISSTDTHNNNHTDENTTSENTNYPHMIKYSSYVVQEPFTSLRASLVELVVLMVESDEAVASTISVDLWKLFMNWTIKYGFNSIYHALFYRLIFAALR